MLHFSSMFVYTLISCQNSEGKLDSDYKNGKTFKQNESQQMLIGTINDKK